MLYARAGNRCERPTPSISSNSACNARPVHTGGQLILSRLLPRPRHPARKSCRVSLSASGMAIREGSGSCSQIT